MPPINLTVRLSFATGEESIARVEVPGLPAEPESPPVAPYRLDDATAPEEPTLISSPDFVDIR